MTTYNGYSISHPGPDLFFSCLRLMLVNTNVSSEAVKVRKSKPSNFGQSNKKKGSPLNLRVYFKRVHPQSNSNCYMKRGMFILPMFIGGRLPNNSKFCNKKSIDGSNLLRMSHFINWTKK